MDENQLPDVQFMNNGYTYPVSEGFMDFFGGGVSAALLHSLDMGPMHDQESAYWSMHMNLYEYGLYGSESTSYYGLYEDNNHSQRLDFSRGAWEYPSMTIEENIPADMPPEQDEVSTVHSFREERSTDDRDAVNPQVLWQDDIDPDAMTYEELLDLGEAVGTQSRGLSQELINLLPTSKHKSGGFFSRRRSRDKCVICLMRYKRGDGQITLPCKHAYHTKCASKWLTINKACPVCNTEVFADDKSTNGEKN